MLAHQRLSLMVHFINIFAQSRLAEMKEYFGKHTSDIGFDIGTQLAIS